jgi:hypothetical protein
MGNSIPIDYTETIKKVWTVKLFLHKQLYYTVL